jgi:hypothetical protein
MPRSCWRGRSRSSATVSGAGWSGGDVLRRLERRSWWRSTAVQTGANAGAGSRRRNGAGRGPGGPAIECGSATSPGARTVRRGLVDGMSPLRLDACPPPDGHGLGAEPSLPPRRAPAGGDLAGPRWRPRQSPSCCWPRPRALVLGRPTTGERLARRGPPGRADGGVGRPCFASPPRPGPRDEAIARCRPPRTSPARPPSRHRPTVLARRPGLGPGRPDEARRVLREAAAKLAAVRGPGPAGQPRGPCCLDGRRHTSDALEMPTASSTFRTSRRPSAPCGPTVRRRPPGSRPSRAPGHPDRPGGRGLALRQEPTALALYHAMTLDPGAGASRPPAPSRVAGRYRHEMALSSHDDVARGALVPAAGVIAVFRGRPRTAPPRCARPTCCGPVRLRPSAGACWCGLAMAEAMGRPCPYPPRGAGRRPRPPAAGPALYDADWVAGPRLGRGRRRPADQGAAVGPRGGRHPRGLPSAGRPRSWPTTTRPAWADWAGWGARAVAPPDRW